MRYKILTILVLLVATALALVIGLRAIHDPGTPQAPGKTSHGESAPAAHQAGTDHDLVAATVHSVYDGDTMTVDIGADRLHLRLLGIDAPELTRDGSPSDCGALAARDRLRQLAPEGSRVLIGYDLHADRTDRYQRHLVYVEQDQTRLDLAGELVAEGLAEAWYPRGEPEPERYAGYSVATDYARSRGLGSWAECPSIGR